MPHLIIEFSNRQAEDEQIECMLDAVHQAAAATELFEEEHIRVRAYPIDLYRSGGRFGHFIHAQLRLHRGRSEEQKRELSGAVLSALKAQRWPAKTITVDVVDMDRDSYAKWPV